MCFPGNFLKRLTDIFTFDFEVTLLNDLCSLTFKIPVNRTVT